mmetsp:Transcript_336/g.1114  ORF Transcript_336/g.1114 Transcript_336/m.1114 type:complete len:376 (+) Transcript_336:81-1208(+)|eukprot:scaffold439_cov415-Prasinococcus_capsulatus_cf.AAC.43
MPVPVAVTGWHSKPSGAVAPTVIEDEGGAGSFWSKFASTSDAPPADAEPAATVPEAAAVAATPAEVDRTAPSVVVKELEFTYPGPDGYPLPGPPMISGMNLTLMPGQRCLLIGANGAGKTTLLKLIGGKHMLDKDTVRVLGRPAFHDTYLTSSGQLSYLGGQWRRDVAFAGYDVPLSGDFSVRKMFAGIPAINQARREELVKVLDIDLDWRMHQVSDGQRRRVQIAMGLIKPFQVLLLDEITVDLDVLVRRDLMSYLVKECEERGATIIYATHIFDGLDDWATHIAYVARGRLQFCRPTQGWEELESQGLGALVQTWLREEKKLQKKRELEEGVERPARGKSTVGLLNNGYGAGRLNATMKLPAGMAHSSNAVLR